MGPANGIIATSPEEFSLYIDEHSRWPDLRLHRYTVRRDGFASMHATAMLGEWMTRPLIFEGSHLHLNYSTSAAGYVRVEVCDESGEPIPGFELSQSKVLFGDEIDGVFEWQNGSDISALQGSLFA